MQITARIPKDIRFDPATGSFQAIVTIDAKGCTYRYPCACTGPIAMPYSLAALKLMQQAKARHDARDDLHSVHPAQPTEHLWSDSAALPRAA